MTGDKEIKAVFGEKEDPGEDENVLKFDIANTAYWDFGGNHTRDPEIEIFEEGDKKELRHLICNPMVMEKGEYGLDIIFLMVPWI